MADNTIANAIKFLKGEEKSLPATKTEGQVYFAYKNVGTAEKPSYTGAIYIDTPIGGTQNRIKMTANADIADKAFNDSAGLSIRDAYLSSLGYTDDGKQTILIKGSGNNQTRIALPIASTTKSGIVTTDAQSFGGIKTFTTINSTNLTVTGSDGFNYSSIGAGTADVARPVWFADNSGNGKPVINTNFTYNPATQTLSVANLSGTADKANKDSAGNDIRNTYVKYKTIKFSATTDKVYLLEGNGAGSATATSGENISTTIIPAATDKAAGVITTAAQTFSGDKTFNNSIIVNDCLVSKTIAGTDKSRFIILPRVPYSMIDSTHDTSIYFKELLKWICVNYPNKKDYSFIGLANPNVESNVLIHIYDTGVINAEGYPEYSTGLFKYLGGTLCTFGTVSYNYYCRDTLMTDNNFAGSASPNGAATSANKLNTNAGSSARPIYFSGGVPVQCNDTLANSISGNAFSATQLQTTRTIFGRSFNGTADISGQAEVFGSHTTAENRYFHSGIQIRENDYVGASQSDIGYAPSIGFHWGGRTAATLLFHSDGNFYFRKQNGIDKATIDANLNGNATGLTDATGGSNTIKVGWNGDGLTSSKIHSLAAYSTDAVLIKDAPKSAVREWLGPMPASDVYAWAKASTKPNYSWGEITGKPSTFTPSSHTHYSLSTIGDQRSTATTPNSYSNTFVFQGLKSNETIGITNAGNYSYVLGLRGWNDPSGGDSHELAFNGNLGILTRSGATTWNAWRRILDSSNYTEYTVTKSGSGASGTWGINVTGSAGSVAWGNIAGKPSSFTPSSHTHPYLPLAGGTMNGTSFITWADSRNWDNNNNNVTFPVTRGGLQWYGQSDSIKLFSQETASDNLELVLQFEDDNSNGLSIRDCTGTQTARITAEGKITASSFIGNLSGNAATATKLQTARTISLTGSVTGSGTFDGSGNLSITTSTNHTHSQYLPLAGGTMTGTINFTTNKLACMFGGSTSAYYSGVMHQNFGNEAIVFAATNSVTSFIFKCGQNPTSMANNTWANITPSMQIKQQSVYINSLIANGVTPSYNLYVNGTTRCNGTLGVGNGSSAEIDFFPNSSSTIGARIKAYNDRIEFVFS